MSVATNSVLQKQQNRLPTSMRFERVQEILSTDPALSTHLGPRNHPIPSRYGEQLMFSKEVVDVTNAIHAEGKDAHSISKNEVLKAAARILMKFTPNGNGNSAPTPVTPVLSPEPTSAPLATAAPETEKKAQKPKAKTKSQPEAAAAPVKAPEPVETKIAPKAIPSKKAPPAKPEASKPKAKATAAKPIKINKDATTKKPEPPVRSTVTPQRSNPKAAEEPEPATELPESELPPEKQPLHLPAAYDPKKYPHYDVQSTAYSMLLSALTLVTHYERFAGYEARQKKLEDVLKEYLATCNQITIG